MSLPPQIAARVADHAPAGLVYLDTALHVRFVNRQCTDLLGYAPGEFLGRGLAEMLDAGTLRYARSHVARLEQGQDVPLPYVLRHRNGSPRYLSVRAIADYDREGRKLGYFACTLDRAGELSTGLQLRDASERLDVALAGAEACLWDWDLDSRRVYYSSGFKRLLGYEEAGFPCESAFFGQLHPEDAERTLDAVAAAIEEGAHFDREFRMRCAPGGYRWLRGVGRSRRSPSSGLVARFSGTVCDISTRKEAQLRLTETRRLVDAILDRTGHGRARLGHELRTPLASVIAALELLQEGAAPGAPHTAIDDHGLVTLALENADRLARLVERLLEAECCP
jgi:PAS domain S-box-containing protein